jgi:ABC-type bacteriocin/lantibiotic exporter with double-glycine peptidase domain
MKIRSFLQVLFFTAMFTIYQSLSWFVVVLLYDNWFFQTMIPYRELFGIGLLISILSGGPVNTLRTQLRLAFYHNEEQHDRFQNKSMVYAQILIPYVFLVVGLILNIIYR